MTMTTEQVTAANKANLETLVGLTTKAFSGVEKLIEIELDGCEEHIGWFTKTNTRFYDRERYAGIVGFAS